MKAGWQTVLQDVLQTASPSVVQVSGMNRKKTRLHVTSGTLLDKQHVLIHSQAMKSNQRLSVTTLEGDRAPASLVGSDRLYRLAVVRLSREIDAPPATFLTKAEEKATLRPGLVVAALGNPFGTEVSITAGVVSATRRVANRPWGMTIEGLLATDAAIHAGNSGGPLCQLDGKVVGINGSSWSNHLAVAVRSSVALRVADELISGSQTVHPWLGLEAIPDTIDEEMVSLFALPADQGVVVTEIIPDGPADRAGIKVFDMIVRFAGKPLPSLRSLRRVLSSFRIGDTTELTLLRGGELVDIQIEFVSDPQPKNH